MRRLVPSSRGNLKLYISPIDLLCAIAAPVGALYINDAYILSFKYLNYLNLAVLYCGISAAFSLIAFVAFRLGDGFSNYFSVRHFITIVKAVFLSEIMTCVVLFTFTRLEGIPRSTPLLHALILAFGLVSVRALNSILVGDRKTYARQNQVAIENILMIGMTHLSSLYIELLAACSSGQRRIIGVLDDHSNMIGRSTSVVGPIDQLGPIVDEFAVHGIHTDRVIVGGDENLLSEETLSEIRLVCAQRSITLDFVPDLVGLGPVRSQNTQLALDTADALTGIVTRSPYFAFKRFFDFIAAIALIIVLLPLWIVASGLVLIDVGLPIFFWQQRIGLRGRPFLVYKFRTMRPPYDWTGAPIPQERRISWIGYFLRETRLDEIPQLLNVLVGDMNLIGPRPLLPQDQPANPATRLTVRPGITGWAQINGGTTLTPDEKDKLDEWYICNATFWWDWRIIFMTLSVLIKPRRQSMKAHADAALRTEQDAQGSLRKKVVGRNGSGTLEKAQKFGSITVEDSPSLSPAGQIAAPH